MLLRELYRDGIEKFEFGQTARKILTRFVADNVLSDLESAIAEDAFFTEKIVAEASILTQHQPIKSLSQAVTIIGPAKTGHFMIGHTINRIFNSRADQNYKSMSVYNQKLKRAKEAENLAKALNCPAIGAAFAAGLLFDVFEEWLMTEGDLKQKYMTYFQSVWSHSLRTAAIAWALSTHKKNMVTLQRLVFSAGLLHDIGKLLLAFTFSERYHDLLLKFAHFRQKTPLDDSFESRLETETFGLAHPEAGSLLLWQVDSLKDWEALVEYHHDFTFLEIRDARLNQVEVTVNIADKIAFFLETTNSISEGVVQEITEKHALLFPIPSREIMETLLTLRSNRLLV